MDSIRKTFIKSVSIKEKGRRIRSTWIHIWGLLMTLRKRHWCWLDTSLLSTYLWPGAGSSYIGKLFWHDSILTYIEIVFGFLYLSLLSTKDIFYGAVYILCEKNNTLTQRSPTFLDQRLVSGFVEDMAHGWGMAWG